MPSYATTTFIPSVDTVRETLLPQTTLIACDSDPNLNNNCEPNLATTDSLLVTYFYYPNLIQFFLVILSLINFFIAGAQLAGSSTGWPVYTWLIITLICASVSQFTFALSSNLCWVIIFKKCRRVWLDPIPVWLVALCPNLRPMAYNPDGDNTEEVIIFWSLGNQVFYFGLSSLIYMIAIIHIFFLYRYVDQPMLELLDAAGFQTDGTIGYTQSWYQQFLRLICGIGVMNILYPLFMCRSMLQRPTKNWT